MAAAGTLGAVSCLWPLSPAILWAPSPSFCDTTRMSATTVSPGLSLSARSERVRPRLRCRRLPPLLPLPASSRPCHLRSSPLAAACPPLSPPSPVPAVALPFRPCALDGRPSCYTVSGLYGDGGDDTTADDAECVGEGGSGGGAACIPATSTITFTDPGPPNPLTICGGGVAATADDGLYFGSGKWDIFRQHMASCP